MRYNQYIIFYQGVILGQRVSFTCHGYREFHRFGQAKFLDGGSILSASQFFVLPQLHPKTMCSLKEVKIVSKISNVLC